MSNGLSRFLKDNKYILIALILIAGVGLFVSQVTKMMSEQVQTNQSGGVGSIDIGGDFTLIDHNGNTFTQENLKNKNSLIFFGFTHCPDICPAGLSLLADVYNKLPDYMQNDMQILFVTIDPKRDTPDVLKDYVTSFSPAIIGLSGSSEQIKTIADAYLVYYAKNPDSDPEYYMMDHSSYVYLMDKNGDYVKHFSHHDKPSDMVKFIKNNVK